MTTPTNVVLPREGAFVLRARRVVIPAGERAAAVQVEAGRITAIHPWDDPPAGVTLADLPESWALLPGVVDTHVHVNEPGRTEWEGFDTATRSAVAGGITTLVDMPLNSVPATVDVAGLRAKVAAMAGVLHADVGLWGGAIPGNADGMRTLAAAGVLGFKAFLTPSGVDEFPCVDEEALDRALAAAAATGLPLLLHAEDPARLRPMSGDPRRHATWEASRPPAAEVSAIGLLARLAGAHGARVHVVHVASEAAASAVVEARARGVRMSAETCPHYLTFDSAAVPDGATSFKCAPPLRGAAERDALWAALAAGDLDFVASDHSPSPPAMKCLDTGDFRAAWGGMASLELVLSVVWTGARAHGHGLPHLARWMSAGPAELAGLAGVKGVIAPGADADLVAFAPDETWCVDAARLHHRHTLTPYDGFTLRGRVRATWRRGTLAWNARSGAFGEPLGHWLRRDGAVVRGVDPATAIS